METIHGSSYVRPPIQSVPLYRTFQANETFRWRGHEFLCFPTPGNSPGSMTYLLKRGGHRLAFSGDVMLDGATMHTWFDTEWDYGHGAGIRALRKSVTQLEDREIGLLLPAHGPAVRKPRKQFLTLGEKLERLEQLYVRGCGGQGASAAYQDEVSKPTVIPNVGRSRHICSSSNARTSGQISA